MRYAISFCNPTLGEEFLIGKNFSPLFSIEEFFEINCNKLVLYHTEGKAQNTILKVIHTSRERFEKYSFKSFAVAEKYLLSLRNISVNFLHKHCIYGEKVSSYCFEIVSIEDDEDYPINYKYISTKTNFDMDEYRTTGKVVLKDAI